MTQVRVEGGAKLRRALKKAGVDMKELAAINRQAATIVANAAKPSAPKMSGDLGRSVRAGATNRAGVVRAGRSSIPYAGPIHWGWPARGIRPHPWITEAAQATEPQWVAEYRDHMKQITSQIGR